MFNLGRNLRGIAAASLLMAAAGGLPVAGAQAAEMAGSAGLAHRCIATAKNPNCGGFGPEQKGLAAVADQWTAATLGTVLDADELADLQNEIVSPVDRSSPLRNASAAPAASVGRLPEPATWVLLLFGFGAVGGLLRFKLRQSEKRFNDRIRRIEAGESL